jgi:hypothetical protein
MAEKKGLAALVTDALGNLRVTLQGNSAITHLTATRTKVAGTTGYTAKDAINDSATTPTVLSYANAVQAAGGKGRITGARLETSDVASTARIRQHFYAGPPTVNSVDNAAFVIEADDSTIYLGYIDYPPPQVEGTGSELAVAQAPYAFLPIRCVATTLYSREEVLDAIVTATDAATYKFTLEVERY